MKYMLLIYSDRSEFAALPEEEQRAIHGEYMALDGHPGIGHHNQLQPGATATTVRVQDGATLTTDGPFIETKEELGGYYLLEADDLDAAIEVAARIPAARTGVVEIRPVVER